MKNTLRIFFLAVVLLLFISPILHAQQMKVTGTVSDTLKRPLPGITVMLRDLTRTDIALGSITSALGKFSIDVKSEGLYRLSVISAGYAAFIDTLKLDGSQPIYDLGLIPLATEIKTFEAESVLIEAEQTPMLIKGDTVEYNASSYDTRTNAVLEKLLEQLPGIEVQEDGSITAEGQPVQKIQIDGKEFFGNNVKLAVKNIPVDAILKIQVTDSKSEESEFTGVDDGQRLKTINLVLKSEKRSGYFGTLAGGYGLPDDRYVGRSNAFRFSSRMQLSILGLANNVNEVGFGWDQIREFMGGWENMGNVNWNNDQVGIGGVNVGLPTQWSNDDGFITTQAGGINLNYDINDKTDITTTYLYGGARTIRRERTYRENFLSDNTFTTEDSSLQERRTDGHAFNMRIRHKIDSTQEINIQTAGSWSKENTLNDATNRSINVEGILQNGSERNTGKLQEAIQGRTSLNYRKRFLKKGRNLYLGIEGGAGDEDTDSDIRATNSLYNKELGEFDLEELIQEQIFEGDTWNYNFYSGYNEPINEHNFLSIGFNRSHDLEDNLRDAFDLDPDNGMARIRNVALSNHFRRSMEQNRINLGYRLDTDHFRIRARINGEQTRLNNQYLSADTTVDQQFYFVLPDVDIRYTFEDDLRLEIEYDTYVREPSLYQLQPFVDNTNPLRIYQGNPSLKPTYNHQFEIGVRKYNRQTRKGFGASIDLEIATDAISVRRTVDSLLRQISQPVNVERAMELDGRLWYRHPFPWLKSRLSMDLNAGYEENIVFLNGVSTPVERFSESVRVRIENRDKKVIGFYLMANLDMNQTQYAGREEFNRNTFNQRYVANIDFVLNTMWTVGSNFSYRKYGGDAFNEQQTVPIWSAEIMNYPFRDERLELKLSGTDLLSQNVGIRRSARDSYIEEEEVESLTQYFLLTATWKLSKLSVGDGRKKFSKKKKK